MLFRVPLSPLALACLVVMSLLARAQAQTPTERIFTTEGTVRQLLPESRLVLIAHAEIPGLMDAMDSMAFSVDEHPVLRTVKAGDHVRFTLRQSGSTLTLLRIDLAP